MSLVRKLAKVKDLKVTVEHNYYVFMCEKCNITLALKHRRSNDVYFLTECQHFKICWLLLSEVLQLVKESKVVICESYGSVYRCLVRRD